MKALAVAMVLTMACFASDGFAADGNSPRSQPLRPQLQRWHAGGMQHSGSSTAFSKAPSDSFNIYGGVRRDGTNDRRPEGQFESIFQNPELQGWIGRDLTENPAFWHVSPFNANNLDAVVDNHAMWSGVENGTTGFSTAPGYGNNWDDRLEWVGQTNPVVFTNVRLRFDYNHDTEPAFDFFHVEIDSGGSWVQIFRTDGSNKEMDGTFVTPASFDQTTLFTPFMYTGPQDANVRLRLRVTSDGAWSDEDGLFPTKGAAQVDNIRVDFNGAIVTQHGDGIATMEDLGGGVFDTEGWTPFASDFAGDFTKIVPQLTDLDLCRSNESPQIGFMDDGTPPNNAPLSSTGGTTSTNWSYGVEGGWVLNYNGGLSLGVTSLDNEWWSPEIEWDDVTTTGDDGLVGGAFIRFDTWRHLPLLNGFFYTWHVRSNDGVDWTPWRDRNFVYYGDDGGTYLTTQAIVSDLMTSSPERVQIALGATDLASLFNFPGTDATPSPVFDNVSFWRFNLDGPAFSTRNIDLFNDGFPTQGGFDPIGDPASMAVRIDMARDVNSGLSVNAPGDSIICDIIAVIPGTVLSGLPSMEFVLDANPLFDGVRSLPGGVANIGPNGAGWDQWRGTVTGDSARTSNGTAIADRFFFDAPNDGDAITPYHTNEPAMFFSGDRFRYFLRAADDLGNVTTLPPDTTGFHSGVGYNRVFTVKALPTFVSDGMGGATHPEILFINDFGHRGGEAEFLSGFGQIGLFENSDYDVYTVMGPSSLVSNGIGSSGGHGATASQLSGYHCLLYEAGDLQSGVLSDGSNVGGNDKGDDVGVLTDWHNLPGDRAAIHFGDYFASFLSGGSPSSQTYLNSIMSVSVNDFDVRDEIGNQSSPLVVPTGNVSGFSTSFIAYGSCPGINQFDSIVAIGNATNSHEFSDGVGGTYTLGAMVWHERQQDVGGTLYDRVDVMAPYGFLYVRDPIGKAPAPRSARARLMEELLAAIGHLSAPGSATATTPQLQVSLDQNLPNPFNPSTRIHFVVGRKGPVKLAIYNVRGELVRTLADREMDAGTHFLDWDGRDHSGATASSGVYLYRLVTEDQTLSRKMTLLK